MGITDESDEESPLPFCIPEKEFRCQSSGRCILRELVMNGKFDCNDTSDENGTLTCNPNIEFRCATSGRCIPRYRVNDNYNDCNDTSDENIPNFVCNTTHEFACDVTADSNATRCIPRGWFRNKIKDCPLTGNDEPTESVEIVCTAEEFRCKNGNRCIDKKYLCDGVQNCDDCSDEIEACGDSPRRFRCHNSTKCIPWSNTCDGTHHCADGSDENTGLGFGFKCNIEGHRCLIPQFQLPKEENDQLSCSDKSDACSISGTCATCLDGKTKISRDQLCDGWIDCPDLSDECVCSTSVVEHLCDEIFNQTIKLNQVCDGKKEKELDEKFCINETLLQKFNEDHDFQCGTGGLEHAVKLHYTPTPGKKCDGKLDCLMPYDECNDGCNKTNLACPKYALELNTVVVCTNLKGISFPISTNKVCDGVRNCKDGSDESSCTNTRFPCNAGTTTDDYTTVQTNITSVPIKKKCDLVIDCAFDQLDEIGCPNSSHFYCSGGKPLFIERSKVRDGKIDCEDRSDECPPEEFWVNNPFSDYKELFKNILMRVCVWFTAIFSVVANLNVIVFSTRKLKQIRQKNSVGFCNRLLILNLALADLVMGISLLILASKSVQMSGEYCIYDLLWRTSSLCNLVGTLTIISTQASINILLILTTLRLYVTLRPMTSAHVIRHRLCNMMATLSWIVSIFFAVYPLLRNHFKQAILINSSPFFTSTQITSQELNSYVSRSEWLANKTLDLVIQENTPVDIRSVVQIGFFGYYSNSSVCFPNLYTQPGSPHFAYSLFIVVFNFCAIIFIAAAYITIYRSSSLIVANPRHSKSTDDGQQDERKTLRRRITVVIATNTMCLLPICLMAFVSFSGKILPSEAYSLSSVLLLPVNSLVNPIVYSTMHRRVYHTIAEMWRKRKDHGSHSLRSYEYRSANGRSHMVSDVTEHIELNSG